MANESRPQLTNSSAHLRETHRDIRQWGCGNCGQVAYGPTYPDACPNCHAAGDEFRRV